MISMNTIYVPAFAAFGGSAFGAISTIVPGWVSRRRRLRERHYTRSIAKRERLYRSFIEEASRLYTDAARQRQIRDSANGQSICARRADENSFQR
jgi:hypothetical protein